jgi:DnaD/phage-associated family protein
VRRFLGFPDGRIDATPVPSLFLSELLGLIDDLAELKVTLYVLWRGAQEKTYPRFVTRRQLEGDPIVVAGLAVVGPDALAGGLDRAVARGTLLRRTMTLHGRTEECYFVNGALGRRAIRDLESGKLDLGQVVAPADEADGRHERSNIFKLYEENIGMLTPLLAEQLGDAEERFPPDWIADAFQEAVANNRRSWRYIQRILERWATEGKDDAASGRRAPRAYPGSKSRPNGRG